MASQEFETARAGVQTLAMDVYLSALVYDQRKVADILETTPLPADSQSEARQLTLEFTRPSVLFPVRKDTLSIGYTFLSDAHIMQAATSLDKPVDLDPASLHVVRIRDGYHGLHFEDTLALTESETALKGIVTYVQAAKANVIDHSLSLQGKTPPSVMRATVQACMDIGLLAHPVDLNASKQRLGELFARVKGMLDGIPENQRQILRIKTIRYLSTMPSLLTREWKTTKFFV